MKSAIISIVRVFLLFVSTLFMVYSNFMDNNYKALEFQNLSIYFLVFVCLLVISDKGE